MKPFEINVKKIQIKEMDILKRNNECVFPCRTGEILQERLLFSTAVCEEVGDFRRESQ